MNKITLVDKMRGNYIYDNYFNFLLGNQKDYTLHINVGGDVMIKCSSGYLIVLSRYSEDLEFYKKLFE